MGGVDVETGWVCHVGVGVGVHDCMSGGAALRSTFY